MEPKNKSESTPGSEEMKNHKDNLLLSAKGIFSGIRKYIYDFMHIKDEVDFGSTMSELKKGLDFGGARAWILMGAIIIASVGLNSGHLAIAVIIGAMLVAPLMSPILLAGISLATNDWSNLKKSTRSLVQAVSISLIGATLWFIISPINTPSDAIIARTIPTIYDVIVALVGGLVFTISTSLKDKGLAMTVVPGVAIATSLMPPLCTAGFGLAHLNFAHFAGAFYLFILNAVFISFSGYLFVKLMNFPKVHLEDEATESRNKKYIFTSLAIIVIPSIWIFIGVVKDSIFKSNVDYYVENVITHEGSNLVEYKSDRATNSIEVFMLGENIPDDVQSEWKKQLAYYELDDATLIVSQSKNISEEHLSSEFIEEMYKDKDIQINEKDEKIKFLESQLAKNKPKKTINLLEIEKEIQINYNKVQKLSYNESIELNFNGKVDTIPTFMVKWESDYKGVEEDSKRLVQWLELRLKINSPRIVNY
jgi:uncharacterized hydrophobic protein (TIGR00271 family)